MALWQTRMMHTRTLVITGSGAASLLAAAGIAFGLGRGSADAPGEAETGLGGPQAGQLAATQDLDSGCARDRQPPEPAQVSTDDHGTRPATAATEFDAGAVAPAGDISTEPAPAAPASVQQAVEPPALPVQPVSRLADGLPGAAPTVKESPAAPPGATPGARQPLSRFADGEDSAQLQRARATPFPGKMKPMGSP